MKLQKLTPEEIKGNKTREYNPAEWDSIIDRFSRYPDTQFYIEPKNEICEYDRFFASYTIPEGIKFLNEVSYHSVLSNAGFCSVYIFEDGDVITRNFSNGKETGRLENNNKNRKLMAAMTRQFGQMFSNCI